jgi:uncharacterized protein YdiU (UPF0061 family)
MEASELDFNQTFRKLGGFGVEVLSSEEGRKYAATKLFRKDQGTPDAEVERISKWLNRWRTRLVEDWGQDKDSQRQAAMNSVNPKVNISVSLSHSFPPRRYAILIQEQFVPKGWLLDELIERVERKDERDVLTNVMQMALNPFQDTWEWETSGKEQADGDAERFCGDVPKYKTGMQCSCSS